MNFDVYVFVLTLIVFTALTVCFTILIVRDIKNTLKMTRAGLNDCEIERTVRDETEKRNHPALCFVTEKVLPCILLAFVLAVFVFSITLKINEKKVAKFSTFKVVESGSMSYKHKNNLYLNENNLNNQIYRFDLIIVSPLPKENELELYDIVVYEYRGELIVHRIIGIEEPNETHSERRFLLRGDANQYSDTFPVLYSQMRGVYQGQRVPYIGSFVVFLNSPSGYMCVALVVFVLAIYPFIEKKINACAKERLAVLESQKAVVLDETVVEEPQEVILQEENQVENSVDNEILPNEEVEEPIEPSKDDLTIEESEE